MMAVQKGGNQPGTQTQLDKTGDCVLVKQAMAQTQLDKTGDCVLVKQTMTQTQLDKTRVCVLVKEAKPQTQLDKTGDCVLVKQAKPQTQLDKTRVCVLVRHEGDMEARRDLRELVKEIKKREKDLMGLMKKLEPALASAPEGGLRSSKSPWGMQYYIRSAPSDRRGTYVNKSAMPQAAAIAQRDYDLMLRQAAQRELDALKELRLTWDQGTVEDVLPGLTPARRQLVTPRILTDEEYAEKWLAEPYEPKGFKERTPEFYSAKGLRVRSKSEALLADMYDSYGIPMKYECPLKLKNGRVIHPDFKLLLIAERKVFIHEHLGMMDDPTYATRALRRLMELEMNGWYPGVNLIVTFETKNLPLDMRVVRHTVERLLL